MQETEGTDLHGAVADQGTPDSPPRQAGLCGQQGTACEAEALDLADRSLLFLFRRRRCRVWCLSRDLAGGSMTSEVIEDEKQFYSKAKTYWKEVPPTVDGMLGGYGHISSIDINSSRKFLQRFLRVGRSGVPSRSRGSGVGATFTCATAGSSVTCRCLPSKP